MTCKSCYKSIEKVYRVKQDISVHASTVCSHVYVQ